MTGSNILGEFDTRSLGGRILLLLFLRCQSGVVLSGAGRIVVLSGARGQIAEFINSSDLSETEKRKRA